MLNNLRSRFDGGAEDGLSFAGRFDLLLDCHLLVLDDLGMESDTAWVQEQLDTLVNYRWLRRLPLVVTTNAMPEDLPPRLADRLWDTSGRGCPTLMKAPSYRHKAESHEA